MVEEGVPINQAKEEESENDEYDKYYRNGDELDDALDFLIKLEGRGQLLFEDIKLLMDYVDARLSKKVLRQALASRLRSPSQRNFCLRKAIKAK